MKRDRFEFPMSLALHTFRGANENGKNLNQSETSKVTFIEKHFYKTDIPRLIRIRLMCFR